MPMLSIAQKRFKAPSTNHQAKTGNSTAFTLESRIFSYLKKKKIGVASTSMKWDKFWEINLNYKPGFEHTKDAYYINESCEKNHQNFRGQFFIYHFFESILWSPVEADGPSARLSLDIIIDDTTHKARRYKRFITSVTEVSRRTRHSPQKGLKCLESKERRLTWDFTVVKKWG